MANRKSKGKLSDEPITPSQKEAQLRAKKKQERLREVYEE